MLGSLHTMPCFPHMKTLQSSYLPFLSVYTKIERTSHRLSICSSRSFLHPFPPCSVLRVTHMGPHGPCQQAPLPIGVQCGPAHAEHQQGIWEGGEGDQDPLLAPPCNSSSSCGSALSTLPSLSVGSRNHLLPFPFGPRRGGHGHVVRSHIGTRGNRN